MSLIDKLSMESSESFEATEVEFEFELYLLNSDVDAIASRSFSKHDQEQWGIKVESTDKNLTGGVIRARRTIKDDTEVEYTQTIKTKLEDGTDKETEIVVEQSVFDHISTMSEGGLIKSRYMIAYQTSCGKDLVVELDVFKTIEGDIIPWVKVDIEIPEGVDGRQFVDEDFFRKEIQLDFERVIFISPDMKTSGKVEDKQLLDEVQDIYNTYFVSKNKHI